jgi:hypothetical protein
MIINSEPRNIIFQECSDDVNPPVCFCFLTYINSDKKLAIIKVKHIIQDNSFSIVKQIAYDLKNSLGETCENLIDYISCQIMTDSGQNFLICACKKYKSNQTNGIFILDVDSIESENIKYKYYKTNNFIPYCFCQIYSTIFLIIGGYNVDKRQGEIRLYKIINGNIVELIYIQSVEIFDDDFNNFNGIDMPINNIIQTKDSGKIIVTTLDGYIFLFNKPNLDYYNKKHKG